MTGPDRPVTEEELHAYVDEQLDPGRGQAVERYLRDHSEAAQTVAAWAAQRRQIRASLAHWSKEPLPPKLDLIRLVESRLLRRRTRWPIAASIVLALALGGSAGWFFAAGQPVNRTQHAMSVLGQQAIATFMVYANDPHHPIEVSASEREHLVQWLSNRLKRPVVLPDLTAAGYHLLGGRLLATERGSAAALLMYENATGDRLGIVVRPMAPELKAPQTDVSERAVNGCIWIEKGLGFGVVAEAPDEAIDRISDLVRAQAKEAA
ncbi:MAG: anti-sigma factor [Acetobacteraceae bacterium]|nr:anti-sigma factor [Acetobacteraceae bacterium]